MKPFIGLKKLWYGPVFDADVTATTLKAWIAAASGTEVKNVHGDTWGYTEDDPSTTDYTNALTGRIYYRDVTQKGAKTVAFTLGEYSFDDKKALQGGDVIKENTATVGWKEPETAEVINKGIVAMTKTGNYIVFTNAAIIGKGNFVEKNIGLGVTAVAMENPSEGVSGEYWFDGEKVDAAQG